MRVVFTKQGSLVFDSGRIIEPPLLLALPFGVLTMASAISGGFSAVRVLGLAALFAMTAVCLVLGLRRRRVEVRPHSREVTVNRSTTTLDDGVQLVVSQARSRGFPYELVVIDNSKTRRVLMTSSLAEVLNGLRKLRRVWSIPAQSELETLPSVTSPLAPDTEPTVCSLPDSAELSSATLNRQLALASILGVVCGVACTVVSVLIRQQIQAGLPLTLLGWGLGALLIVLPALIAAHVGLGRIRLSIDSAFVRLEQRRGLLGARGFCIPRSGLLGLWAVRNSWAQRCELLLLEKNGFRSFPIASKGLEAFLLQISPACSAKWHPASD